MDKYRKLRKIFCQLCSGKSTTARAVFPNLDAYDTHLQQAHNRFLCSACNQSLRIWPHEREVYTMAELRRHFANGTPPCVPPHPFCQFCTVPFFSEDELYAHMCDLHQVRQFILLRILCVFPSIVSLFGVNNSLSRTCARTFVV